MDFLLLILGIAGLVLGTAGVLTYLTLPRRS